MKVNGVLLDRLVLEEEYVAVLFLGECLEEEKVNKSDILKHWLPEIIHQEACDELVESLEEIDEELDKVDILFVKIDEPQYAKKNKIKSFPAVGLFRFCFEI